MKSFCPRFDNTLGETLFPETYGKALDYWKSHVAKLSVVHEAASFSSLLLGPQGENLTSEVLWIGERHAPHVLVILSGTHGIEGPTGSAIQLDLLESLGRGEFQCPKGLAILLVHAMNPWGYAWFRRCDENGVDLNRNFVDFSAPPHNPAYREIRETLFCTDSAQRRAKLCQYAQKMGQSAMETAVSGGQYEDPTGPFYGGRSPAHGRILTEKLMADYALRERESIAVIDCHTGLGPFGYGEIICDHPPYSAGALCAAKWYGAGVASPQLGTSSSVPKSGLLDYAWHNMMNSKSCFITLEFGTLGTEQLFDVLAQDHLIWEQGCPAPQQQTAQQQRMRNHFIPQDPAWRNAVIFKARQVIALTIRGLLG